MNIQKLVETSIVNLQSVNKNYIFTNNKIKSTMPEPEFVDVFEPCCDIIQQKTTLKKFQEKLRNMAVNILK